ncbi:MAG: DUF262 domain-containing protein [Pseudomonadales bacterium]|nr:DUF262 domain-containing protein [Pseudomonadales bacterium]
MENSTAERSLVSIENLIEAYQPGFEQTSGADISKFFAQLQNIVASNNTLILKTISELLSLNFFVDDYQRGYKWLPQQVEELLNDIHEFEPLNDSFYCLQPVVVKHHGPEETGEKGRWELIDGQQRMTTIYMILSYLNNEVYQIDYKTRASSSEFLQHYLTKTLESKDWDDFLGLQGGGDSLTAAELDNVDNYHFYTAYRSIHDWFTHDARFSEAADKQRWLVKLLQSTKVIWYAAREADEAIDKQKSIDIFMRINSGKIPLTNAELIKALFLHYAADNSDKELALLQQSEMAQQWDAIEHGLQDEEFWYFLNRKAATSTSATRIELLFDLISCKPKSGKKAGVATQDKFFAFNYFNDQLKNAKDERHQVLRCWHQVKEGYYRLLEWYNNDELYHLCGFLISRNIRSIEQLWDLAGEKSKSEYITALKGIINHNLHEYFRSDDQKSLEFSQLQYGTSAREKLISCLMLFNIGVHRNNRTRLSFKTYCEISWDLEHIHAQQSKPLDDQKQADIWFVDQKNLLATEDIPSNDTEELKELLDQWNGHRNTDLKDAKKLHLNYLELLAKIVGDFKDDEMDSLDNLCLLSDTVNRGIGNEIFSIKRQMIINYEKGDAVGNGKRFIPIATKQVFSKYYSESVSQMYKWSSMDRNAYRKALIDGFKYYGPMEGMK